MHISNTLKDKKLEVRKGGSERQELIDRFILELKNDAVDTKYKIDPAWIAIKINRHPSLKNYQALYDFYQKCSNANSFSKTFNYFTRLEK